MEFAFPWPGSQGEWLAFGAAVATALLGLWHFVALLFTHFPNALAVRAQAAGLQFGAGAVAVLMAQPLVYLAIGAGWAAAVLIKIVAMARHGRADTDCTTESDRHKARIPAQCCSIPVFFIVSTKACPVRAEKNVTASTHPNRIIHRTRRGRRSTGSARSIIHSAAWPRMSPRRRSA